MAGITKSDTGMSLKKKIKHMLPAPILQLIQNLYSKYWWYKRLKTEEKLIAKKPKRHRIAAEKLQAKQGPLNVVFFALMDSVWKYDVLYRLMEKDDRFNPTILVCPIVNYGRENMLMNMDRCYSLFKSRGYNVIRSYDEATGRYVDVRKELSPDVIFYTNPYEGLIDDRYFIKKFPDVLTCYTAYGFSESKSYQYTYNESMQNLVWRHYVGFPYQLEKAKAYSRIGGTNAVCTGLPGTDTMIDSGYRPSDPWKIKDPMIKRIIWAPHHTITDYAFVSYSTFLSYHDIMLDLAVKYHDRIQIAFKPHPLLKNRLNLLWGEERTKEYYQKWESLQNGMLNDGAYEDLFLTSDAIIHDSGSYIGEYLYTRKPAMFLTNGKNFSDQYNEFAVKCLGNYYIGRDKKEIENFIINVINGEDSLKEKRELFFRDELLPPHGKLASENIIDDLAGSLQLDKTGSI